MCQNSARLSWTFEDVDKKLEEIEPKLKKLLYTVAACALMAAAFSIVGIFVK